MVAGWAGAHLLEAVVLLTVGAVPAVAVPVGHHRVLVAEPTVNDGVCRLHPADEHRVESGRLEETRVGGGKQERGHEPVHGTWAYPQPTRPSLLDPGVTWRHQEPGAKARLQADRDLAPGPPSLPPSQGPQTWAHSQAAKRCSHQRFQMEGPGGAHRSPRRPGPRRPRVETADSCSSWGQPSLAWGQDRLATVALRARHTHGDRWVCRIIQPRH